MLISSLAFRVLFCFLLRENYILTQQCERSVSFDCHTSSQIFWLFSWYVLKKCQCLAFQVLNYSIRFHCCSYMLLCGSSDPTDHLHVVQVTPLILLFPFMGLLRHLKMIGFVYSVELKQPGSEDKNYCICLKIAWGYLRSCCLDLSIHHFSGVLRKITYTFRGCFVLLVVLFWFVSWFFFLYSCWYVLLDGEITSMPESKGVLHAKCMYCKVL